MEELRATGINRPLTVAMLSLHASPIGPLGTQNTGGMSVYVRELSRWLGHQGHHIDIFTCAGQEDRPVQLFPNVRLITLNQGRFAGLAKEQLPTRIMEMFQALEQFRQHHGLTYDLLHSHYWISGAVGTLAQARWRCPHLIMFHTLGAVKNDTLAGEAESELRIQQEARLAQAADHIVVPAAQERDHLMNIYPAARSKISVIPCGVNLELFRPMARDAARRQLGLPQDAELVLYVGRFVPLKGLEGLIQAAAGLGREFSRLQLLLVGGDDLGACSTQALVELARQCSATQTVRFVGRVAQEQLPVYYSAADLLALPSHYESFGLVLLEALACGTPVAVTAVGAAPDLVREGVNGTILAAPRALEVAQGIQRLLRTPRWQRPAAGPIRAGVQDYGWQAVSRQVSALYEKMMD